MSDAPATATRRKVPVRNVVGAVLGLAVLVGVFGFVLPRFADYGEVWRQLTAMSWWYLIALLVAEFFNIVTYAPNWMVALPGLRVRQALELQFMGTAVSNLAPLGGAVSIGFQMRVMRAWGFSTRAASRAMVVTGVWNNLLNVGLPVVALTSLSLSGGRNAGLTLAAQIGAAFFVVILGGFLLILRSEAGARVIGQVAEGITNLVRRVLRRPPRSTMAESMVRFRVDSADLLRRRWLALTVTSVGGLMFAFLVFFIGLRAVGVPGDQVTLNEAFAAWSVTRLLNAIPITPGGLGIIDVGLAGALTAFGGADAGVVAAVLLYRVLTFVPPIALGAIALFTWRRHPERHAVVDGL